MDTQLVEKIVLEVKSQGVFDEFRKDSMADVDTKPAYQNLRQRVENTVKKFLSETVWTPDTNKNQLREKLRRHIAESGFLDVGVERIVDQVVNPKIGSVFQPRIEEIAYNYLGLPPPPKIYEPPPPPLMHPLPPLPLPAPPPPLKVETCSLLPNDLEQVSPDSDKATVKSEIEGDDKTEVDMDTEEKVIDDEDESPPFEPIVKTEPDIELKHELPKIKAEIDESTLEGTFKKEDENSNATIKTEVKEINESQSLNNFPSANMDKDVSLSMDCRNSQDSQLSSVSSDTRLSPVTKDDSVRSSQEEAVTANISEEAQMPKFNENSSEPNGMNGNNEVDSELHFDIKKDEIKFEGTERKSKLDDSHESPLPDEIKCSLSAESASLDNKNEPFKFSSNNNSNMEQREDDLQRTPNAQELSFGSSIDDSASIPTNTTSQVITEDKEKEFSIEDKSKSPQVSTPKQQQPSTPTPTATPTATPTPPPPFSQTPTATPSPVSAQKTDKEHHTTRHSSSSSSSKHKKHSKERRRSPDRDKDKDRYRSSKDSKHHSSSGSGSKNSSSKHSSSSSSKYSSSSSHNKSNNEKDLEKSSSSSHYSSKQTKHSSSDKRHHSSSSSHRDHSSSSSNTSSKRNERKDDHQEAKQKPPRRKSTDSNDDDGDKTGNGVGKSSSQNSKSSTTNSRLKSKSSSDVNQSPTTKNNDTQKESTENGETLNKPQLSNNVVILNDLLENPQTEFVHLDTRGHLIGVPLQPNNITPVESNNSNDDLLYFEDIQKTFADRIHFLNDTMDLCRRAVNSLRFETPVDEGIEVSSEDDYNHITSATFSSLSASLKRKSTINYEDFEKTPRKRVLNKSEDIALKTSPTPSDISVSSKENEEIDKNTDLSMKLDRHKAAQKLSQQQRYSSDDLYKPRPILGQRSRRRGMDSVV